ncbi:MAG: pilus assembly protein TadG-related protein [Actinomycetota bacterium]
MSGRAADERGTVTIFVLGLCVGCLFLAGLSLDLWRAVAVRRELSAMADAAATAGGNGLDPVALRNGRVRLAPVPARMLATEVLLRHPRARSLDAASITVVGASVRVALRDHVDFTLLRIFLGGDRFSVAVRAEAVARERP